MPWLAAFALAPGTSASQAEQPRPAEQETPAALSSAASPLGQEAMLLRRNSPIRLMVMREVTTKTAHPGDLFPLHVDQDVASNGVKLLAAGTPAWGEVVAASESGLVGKSGKLTTRLLYLELPDRKIGLHGEALTAGTHGAATTAAATVGFALLGGGPLGLLTRGTNAKLKAGEIVTGYVADDQLVAVRAAAPTDPVAKLR